MSDYIKETDQKISSKTQKLTDDPKSNGSGVLNITGSYMILDVCNPGLASRGLEINKQAGLKLPDKTGSKKIIDNQ